MHTKIGDNHYLCNNFVYNEGVLQMMKFIWKNWPGIILYCYMTLFLFWSIGFFANGLYGAKFDLSSVWAGVAAISTAGVISWGKHWTDSTKNSKEGEFPKDG